MGECVVRIALCNEVIASMPFDRQCAYARALGYDGLELAPFTFGDDPHLLSAEARQSIRRAAADAGVAITGLHALLYTPKGLSITTADAALRNRTLDVMRRLIGFAADVGARYLVHGSPMARVLEAGDEDAGRRRGVEAFAAIASDAADAGVVYCIEPLSRKQTAFVNTLAEAAGAVAQIGSPAVQAMIDCSSASVTEDVPVPELIRTWIPRGVVAHVHFNDPNRRGPGEGELAFVPIISALREVGYDGVAGVEPFIFEPDGPGCAARQIGYLRGIEEALRQ
jgi:D-psicose/D-tagatose/L-ribulose 3-epimerase